MNLAASAPRTTDGKPDLTGIWRMEAGAGVANDLTATLKSGETLPWAQALYRQRIEDVMKDDPDVQCLPSGPRRMINGNFAKFVQTPSLLVTLYEALVYRQVFLDGRAPETDPNRLNNGPFSAAPPPRPAAGSPPRSPAAVPRARSSR